MATEKNISQLPSATGVNASDFIHVSQGGVDKKIPATDMSASFTAGQVNDPVVKEESSASRTLTIADKYAYIQCSNTSLTTITVLADTFKAGNFVNLRNVNGGGVTLAAGAGVTISGSSSGLTLSEDKQVGTLLCTGTNTFDFMTGGSASTSIQGAITFPDVATMISGDTLEGGTIADWSGYVGWQVHTVVNNTTSGKGGAEYTIVNANPGNLSTLDGSVWVGVNHDLGGGYYAKVTGPTLYLSQVGARFDASDDLLAVNSALTFAQSVGVNVVSDAGRSIALSDGFVVPDTVHFDGYNSSIRPTQNITGTLVKVVNGGSIRGFTLDLRIYDCDNVLEVTYKPGVGRVINTTPEPKWAEDIVCLGKNSGPIGNVIFLDAQENVDQNGAFQFTSCRNIKATYFNRGIYLRSDGSGVTFSKSWINSNDFIDCEMSYCNYPIEEDSVSDGTIANNRYPNFMFQHSSGNYGLIFHSRADFSGTVWDGGTIQFNSDNNMLRVMSSSLFSFVDNGLNNKVYAHSYEYNDGRTVYNSDIRQRLSGFTGEIKFIDTFLGAELAKPWELSGTGTPTQVTTSTIRGGTTKFPETGIIIGTSANINDTAVVDFGGAKSFTPELRPVMSFTTRFISTTDFDVSFGLYSDANNYIALECSGYNSAMQLVCRSGGVETRQDLLLTSDGVTQLTPTFTTVVFYTIRISETEVEIRAGADSYTSNNLYQGIYLQEKSGTAYSATITTNIPQLELMQPRYSIETTTANSASFVMMDTQIHSRYGFSP